MRTRILLYIAVSTLTCLYSCNKEKTENITRTWMLEKYVSGSADLMYEVNTYYPNYLLTFKEPHTSLETWDGSVGEGYWEFDKDNYNLEKDLEFSSCVFDNISDWKIEELSEQHLIISSVEANFPEITLTYVPY